MNTHFFSYVTACLGKNDSSIILHAWIFGSCASLLLTHLPDLSWLIVAAAALMLLFYFLPGLRFVSIAGLGFCCACFAFGQHQQQILPEHLQGQELQVTGTVSNLPDVNYQRSRFQFLLDADQSGATQLVGGSRLQLSCYRCPYQILPGQRWQFTLRMKQPHGYASWGAFDYEKHLFRHQMIATGYVRTKQENRLLGNASGAASTIANQLRWKISEFLNRNLDGSSVGVAMIRALTIGDKASLQNTHKQVFQNTGISHLLAISGLHIGLVFAATLFVSKLLLYPFAQIYNFIPRQRLVLLPAMMAAFTYAALAGFAVSTQRALLMLSVFVICRLFARDVSLAKTLLLSAALILLFDPFSMLDVGFWLSCGAVMIIAAASERQTSLSLLRLQPIIWLGMVPFSAIFFGQIPLLSPFVNLLLVPLFCLLLIPMVFVSLVLLVIGLQELSLLLLDLLEQCFSLIFQALQFVSELAISQWYPPATDWLDWAAFSALLLVYWVPNKLNRKIRLLLWLLMFFLLAKGGHRIPVGEAVVALLDVGQGLAMVIETRNSVTVYDTGPAYQSGFSTAKAVLIPYLRSRGISTIDTLIISHADSDHIGGYADLMAVYQPLRQLSSRPDKVHLAERCRRGQRWQSDKVVFEILGPDENTPAGSNNLSCVLKVSTGKNSILISGDIEKQVERYMLDSNVNIAADILLVPHQGSKTSSTEAFIDAVAPKLALIAAGFRNHYGHPHAQVTERYERRNIDLVSTIDSGTILLEINASSWNKRAYRLVNQRFWRHQKKPNHD